MKKINLVKKTTIGVILLFMLIIIFLPFVRPIEIRGYFVPYKYIIHGTYIEITQYIGTGSETEIPSYLWLRPVREIASHGSEGGFRELDYVTYVKMPNTVTTLSGAPFWGCWNLKKIEMSQNIKVIPTGCFTNCKKLTNVILSEKIEEINGNAFAGCESLQNITFYNSKTKIGEDVFNNGYQICNFDILTLVSSKDSAVEKYAKEHGIKWEELEE